MSRRCFASISLAALACACGGGTTAPSTEVVDGRIVPVNLPLPQPSRTAESLGTQAKPRPALEGLALRQLLVERIVVGAPRLHGGLARVGVLDPITAEAVSGGMGFPRPDSVTGSRPLPLQGETYLPYDGHWNRRGHDVAAQALVAYLRERNLLSCGPRAASHAYERSSESPERRQPKAGVTISPRLGSSLRVDPLSYVART